MQYIVLSESASWLWMWFTTLMLPYITAERLSLSCQFSELFVPNGNVSSKRKSVSRPNWTFIAFKPFKLTYYSFSFRNSARQW